MSAYTSDALKRMRSKHDENPIRRYEFDDIDKTVDWSEFWNDDGYEFAQAPKNVDIFYIGRDTVTTYAAVFMREQDRVYYGHSVFRYGSTKADSAFNAVNKRNSRRTALVRLFYSGISQYVDVNLIRTQLAAERHTASSLRSNGNSPYSMWLRQKVNKGKTLSEYTGMVPEKPTGDIKYGGTKSIHLSKYAASTVADYEYSLRREIHNAVCVSRSKQTSNATRDFEHVLESMITGMVDALGLE